MKKHNILLSIALSLLLSAIAFNTQANAAMTGEKNKRMHPYANLPRISSFDELEYPFEVHKAKLSDDLMIAYVDQGDRNLPPSKTIILIHGLGSYLKAWNNNIAELSKSYRVIAIDLPGYGKSGKTPHPGSMTWYAQSVVKLMNHLDLEKAWIGGHSMGGQIAMVMALYHPEKVQGLILAAPAGFESFSKGQKQWFRNVMTLDGVKKTSVDDIQNNLYYNFYRMPAEAEFMITERIMMRDAKDFDAYCYAIVQSVNGMVDEPVLPFLEKIDKPTLIIFGENDNLIPNRFLNPGRTRDIARIGHERIKNSKLVMIPKTGHFVQFEAADAFNKAVKEFIQ